MYQGEIYRHISGAVWHNPFQTPSQRVAVALDLTGTPDSALAGLLSLDTHGTLYIGTDGVMMPVGLKIRMN